MSKNRDFADLLKVWRSNYKYSQAAAARVLSVPVRTLQQWEQRRSVPRLDETTTAILRRIYKDGYQL